MWLRPNPQILLLMLRLLHNFEVTILTIYYFILLGI
jgi:hypothetical protein